jgi:hypothetical protein
LLLLTSLLLFPVLTAQGKTAGEYLRDGLHSPNAITNHLLWESVRDAEVAPDSKSADQNSSKGLISLRSLLIPGWGQLSSGNKLKGYVFLGVEAALITAIFTNRAYSRWMEDDYKAFAVQHAGISQGNGHLWYVDMGNWMNNADYNEQRLRDRQFEAVYNSPGEEWQWDSDDNRKDFKSMRIASDRAEQNALLLTGAVILNHLLSAVDATRLKDKTPSISLIPDANGGVSVGLKFSVF